VADECKAAGAEDVFYVSHDLATEAGCVASVEDTVKRYGGKITIWFSLMRSKNAGFLTAASIHRPKAGFSLHM
jgi:predicted SpoU family rRNA methylase